MNIIGIAFSFHIGLVSRRWYEEDFEKIPCLFLSPSQIAVSLQVTSLVRRSFHWWQQISRLDLFRI